MKFKKPLIFCFLSILFSVYGQAQDVTVSGKVIDENGLPIPGVSILIKGTSKATASDMDGNYQIKAASNGTLVYSYVGYGTEQQPINGRTRIEVRLSLDTQALQEVVVVGYGTQKKSDVVSSVAKVNVEKATVIPTSNVGEMLRGQVAGTQVTLGSARPGGSSNILIRGNVSLLQSSDNGNPFSRDNVFVENGPLIVMDGFPIANINDINPDDIASIEVLKDASAQAIYGSRAAKGVVLVTTKRGKSGKVKVDLHSYTTTQQLTRNFDFYTPEEFAQLKREAKRTENGGAYLTPDFNNFGGATNPEWLNYSAGNFVNWEDLILKTGFINSNNLSISGGTESTKVFSSISYFDQKGILPGSGYNKSSFRVNLNQKITEKVNVDFNINYFNSNQKIESTSMGLINISPYAVPYDAAGNLVQFPRGLGTTFVNPLWNARESKHDKKENGLNINTAINFKITDNFSYRLNTLLARNYVNQDRYRSRLHSEAVSQKGEANLQAIQREEYLIENIFNYDLNLNQDHKLALTGVQSINELKNERNITNATGFPNDILGYNGINNASTFSATRDETRQRNASFMGRVSYNAFDKYLLTLTGRYDGASRFAQSNKWGFFPAIAVAWKINKENFLKDVSFVNELKLRASYGSVGNQAIDPYRSLGLSSPASYVFNGNYSGGSIPGSQLPNPNLTWETSSTLNLGLDFGFFKNRLSGSVEYYKTNTTDLLTETRISAPGYSSTLRNAGETENKGIEVLLKGDVIKTKDLTWSLTATWATNENKIIKTGVTDGNGKDIDDLNSNNPRFIGKSINGSYTLLPNGVFQTQAEIDASAQSAAASGGAANAAQIGELRIIDANGDGKIDLLDRTWLAFDPDWYGSISSNLNYKGWELYVDVNFVEGAVKFNNSFGESPLNGNNNEIKRDYYTPERPSNSVPRPTTFGGQPRNVRIIAFQDASYIRLRTLSLAYNFHKEFINQLKLSSLKAYFTGTNLLTKTDFQSYNPENNPGEFPDAQSFTFGVKVGF